MFYCWHNVYHLVKEQNTEVFQVPVDRGNVWLQRDLRECIQYPESLHKRCMSHLRKKQRYEKIAKPSSLEHFSLKFS